MTKKQTKAKTSKYDWTRLTFAILDVSAESQTQLSKRVNLTQQTVSNWVNGTRNPSRKCRSYLIDHALRLGICLKDYEILPAARVVLNPALQEVCDKIMLCDDKVKQAYIIRRVEDFVKKSLDNE
jgi:hypothetical protein